LCQERYVLVNPGAPVQAIRVPSRLPLRLLSEADMEALLAVPDVTDVLGLRDRAILEVFYSTAARNSELCDLDLDAVFLSRGELHVRHGKGDKARVVPLGEEAQMWLAAYLERSRPHLVAHPGNTRVFLSCRGEPFVRQSLALLVKLMACEVGLVVTPHDIRHACATHMLKRGAGLRHLQELLGHASPGTTQRYTRIDITDLRAIHRRYHPREQPPASGGTP
jgi:integrase/recombinase XerD